MMCWHGESHSTISWSVKVSPLMDLLLSVLFSPSQFPAAPPPISPWIALRLLEERRGYILPLSSSNPFGDRAKVDDGGRDKAPNRSCQCRLDDFSRLLFIYKASAGWWLFIWPYSRPLFENELKGPTGYSSLSLLSLLYWNEYSLSVIFQPVVSCVKMNCPPEDKFLHPMQLLHFPLKKCSDLHDKSVNSSKE